MAQTFSQVYTLMLGFGQSMQIEHELHTSTKLAEDFCDEYNCLDWLEESEHPIWDIALSVFDSLVDQEYPLTQKQLRYSWEGWFSGR